MKSSSVLMNLFYLFLITTILGYFIFQMTSLPSVVIVQGTSMEPTLSEGDIVFVVSVDTASHTTQTLTPTLHLTHWQSVELKTLKNPVHQHPHPTATHTPTVTPTATPYRLYLPVVMKDHDP